ncbi:MAG: site-2 protease family protein [Nitrososphaeria archaeon]|nr:site-2 protease family protein [Nitrososphaeria archaeon]
MEYTNTLGYDEITREVSSYFSIIEYYVRPDGSIEYKIFPTEDVKEKFLGLWSSLKNKKYIPILRKDETYFTLYVTHFFERRSYSWKIAIILFAATILSLLTDGWLRATSPIEQEIFGWNPIIVTLLYAISFIGILGLHELGHLILSRKHKMASTLPYFIPGIPGTGVPTFGAIIFATEPMANRDQQFDVGLAGPLFGFIAACIVSVFGVLSSVPMSLNEFNIRFGQEQVFFVNVPLIMNIMMMLLGKVSVSQPTVVILSPLAYAAWFGFLITFLNTLPAWQLDGGHMARSVLPERWHRIATILSALIMAFLGFILMALLVLFFSYGQREIRPLDDVSPVSKSRKLIYVLIIVMIILCAPIPL